MWPWCQSPEPVFFTTRPPGCRTVLGERPGTGRQAGNGAFWGVTPFGLLTSQCPRHRPPSKCLPVPWRDKASHSSPLMIYAPSCSAPCKAFSLNSLPFSRTAAAHICGNQAMATPPTRPARLPQTWLPRPKLPPLPKLPLVP